MSTQEPYVKLKVDKIILSDHANVLISSKKAEKDTVYIDVYIDQAYIDSLLHS